MRGTIALFAAAIMLAACDDAPRQAVKAESGDSSFRQWKLPDRLREVSGLALTRDMRLLAISDEEAVVYELDYRSGVLVKAFALGEPTLRGDFEGIAVLDEIVWLMTSKGRLVAAQEGQDGERVAFSEFATGAGDYCELEGLAEDPQSNSLLLACKQVFEAKDPLRIFTVPIADGKPTGMTWADIPAAEIAARLNGKKVRPSAIALDPQTGNRLLLAANHAALINLAPDGSLIDAIILPGKSRHQQAEGIAISTDGLLLVADEGGDGRARLAVYAWTGNRLELQ
jgi:uncharacterized protein YjiK